MNPRHKKVISDKKIEPEEGQRDLLCRNKESLRCPSSGVEDSNLPEETIQAMKELGEILRGIHNRLISEGYTIKNGIISKPNANTTNTNK